MWPLFLRSESFQAKEILETNPCSCNKYSVETKILDAYFIHIATPTSNPNGEVRAQRRQSRAGNRKFKCAKGGKPSLILTRP